MGILKWLFEGSPTGQAPPVRNPPPLPEIVAEEVVKTAINLNISEPVWSLVETIRNDEWDFKKSSSYCSPYLNQTYVATHVWLGTKLNFYLASYADVVEGKENKLVCDETWMTDEESKMVAEEMQHAAKLHNDALLERHNKRMRESFMIFVEPEYNKEK